MTPAAKANAMTTVLVKKENVPFCAQVTLQLPSIEQEVTEQCTTHLGCTKYYGVLPVRVL